MEYSQHSFLKAAGLEEKNNYTCFDGEKWSASGDTFSSVNPSTNQTIGESVYANSDDYERCVKKMQSVNVAWRSRTLPERGDIVREIGEKLREKRDILGSIISLEMGKIKAEGDGEVQEVIDLCDYACGLSRSIAGKVIPSERPEHSMYEVWNPIGIIGVITAFNFPCAVFGWNLALALVTGNTVHWKGAPSVPLVTIACTKIINEILAKHNALGVLTCSVGGKDLGETLVNDKRVALVSFTGSTAVGRSVAVAVASRFGKSILELGGNNATIVMEDAKEELVIKGSLFAAVGTCGQRCTSLRRLIIHESLYDSIVSKLVKAYATIPIGSQLSPDTLCGPLHSKQQIQTYVQGLEQIVAKGGKVLAGGQLIHLNGGNFVQPTIVEVEPTNPMVMQELFVPILYVMKFKTFEEAVEMNNSVPQGLSSSVFTTSIRTQQIWMGPNGSDCGIVNVNIGNSGAEIGGAFGGEKETGGGRESGSDAWKQYMRRQTCTVNYGNSLPLAQGIKFDL